MAPTDVNNEIYRSLGRRWYEADDDPVALLRAESRLRAPWVVERIRRRYGAQARVLDVGCGGGFLSNSLAAEGFDVAGLDAAPEALEVARAYDASGRVRYLEGDALALPFADASFDVVTCMDFLEHVPEPSRAVAEASRVLRPGGLFFFHTFNRNFLSWLVVIKGVELFVRNVPEKLHVLPLFVRPEELRAYCSDHGLWVEEMHGVAPAPKPSPFLHLLMTGRVSEDFSFRFTDSLRLGYSGLARKGMEA